METQTQDTVESREAKLAIEIARLGFIWNSGKRELIVSGYNSLDIFDVSRKLIGVREWALSTLGLKNFIVGNVWFNTENDCMTCEVLCEFEDERNN